MSNSNKLSINKKNFKKSLNGFFTKKKIMLLSLTSVLVSIPITIGITQISNNTKYYLNGNSFSSLSNAVDYIKNNSAVSQKNFEGNNSKWKISINNTTKTFNTPEELRNFVYDKYISTQTINTNLDLYKWENETGALTTDNDFWKNVYNGSNDINKTIYQGYNDVAYDNEELAKKSYFQVNDGYQFNGIYFKSKSELNNYLLNTYLPNNQNKSFNSIVIEGPNGVKSNAINLNSQNPMVEISEFISTNAKKVLSYTNSTNNKTFDISYDNINSVINDVNVKDLDYVHIYTNEGQSRYVVDNSIYDNNNLIGPYFYNGVLDVGSFMNKNMWRKTTGIKNSTFLSSKIDEMIGSFFTSIINDDNVLNLVESEQDKKTPPIFRTMLYVDDKQTKNEKENDKNDIEKPKQLSLDDWYINEIKRLSPKLAREIETTNRTLLTGKKYNTFFKIPIMYSFIMQRIVSYNLGSDILNLTIDYFSKVANFIQDAIDLVTLYDKSLLTRDDGKVFNAIDFFQIGNPEYNLNTSTEYFLNELKTYSKLVAVISTYMGATNSIALTASLLPFHSYDQNYLFDFGIINKDVFYKDEKKYESIFNSFSKLTYAEMLENYIPNAKHPSIFALKNKPKSEWDKSMEEIKSNFSNISIGSLLKGIGMKNTEYHDLSRALLNSEIRLFNQTNAIMHGGYLSKLYNTDQKKDRLGPFMTLMYNNPTSDAYRIYLALIADIRTNARVYSNSDNIVDMNNFIRNISRLVGFAFGSAYMAGNTIKQIYNHTNKNKKPPQINGSGSSTSAESWTGSWVESVDKVDGWLRSSMVDSIPTATLHPLYEYFKKRGIQYTPESNVGSIGSWGGTIWGDINSNKSKSSFSSTTKNFINLYGNGQSTQGFTMAELNPIDAKVNKPYNSKTPFKSGVRRRIFMDDFISPEVWASWGERVWDVNTGWSPPEVNLPNRPGQGTTSSRQSIVSPFQEAVFMTGENWENASKNNFSSSDFPPTPSHPNSSKPSNQLSKLKRMQWSGKKAISKFKDYAALAANVIAPMISSALFGLEIFFLVSDFVEEKYTQEFYVYTTADGTEFIWDGGLTVSRYLGFEKRKLSGIEDMQLLKPIQVTLPQVEDFYYYNGVKYYDPNLLKKDQLTHLLQSNATPTNKNLKVKYTLSNTSNNDSFDSIEKLIENVVSDIGITKNIDGSYNYSNINKSSKYLSKTSFAFSNGLTTDANNTQIAISQNIMDNIRATKIAMLPKRDTTSNKTIGEIDKFVYPGKYWDGTKVVENNDSTKEYIIDNSANELKEGIPNNSLHDKLDYKVEDILEAETKSKEKLYQSFKNKIIINKKTTIANDFLNKSKYSNMSDGVSKKNLYILKIPNKETMYFADITKAQKYAMAYLKFRKDADMQTKNIYEYNGIIFKGIEEIVEWVKWNTI